MNERFDHIVIGASLPGISAAVRLAELGQSVLLTNACGFPGGSITELLNCRQQADRTQLSGTAADIYDALLPDAFAPDILNPESVKYVLQQHIERSSVTPLFHAVPLKISSEADGMVGVTMLAKEGTMHLTARTVLDATEDHQAAVLCGAARSIVRRSLHLFITPPADDAFRMLPYVRSAVRLDDGRCWVSLEIASRDELFQENEAHELLDSFRLALERSGSRLQMLPLGIHTESRMELRTALPSGVQTLEQRIGRPVVPHELFNAAQILGQMSQEQKI